MGRPQGELLASDSALSWYTTITMIEADPLLGNVLATHPSSRARLLIPAALVVGVAAVVLNFTIAPIEGWGPPVTVVVMTLAGLAAGWPVLHLWNREVVLYEHGFSYREGGRTVFFLYPEVRSIRQRGQQLAYFGGLARRSTYRLTVTTIRDERMTLTSLYSRVERLGARLEERVNRFLRPLVEERLAQGERVPFSDTLRLSSAGLHDKQRDLPWPEYAGYHVGGGRLRLFAQNSPSEWLSLPLGEVDNIALLLELLRERATAP